MCHEICLFYSETLDRCIMENNSLCPSASKEVVEEYKPEDYKEDNMYKFKKELRLT